MMRRVTQPPPAGPPLATPPTGPLAAPPRTSGHLVRDLAGLGPFVGASLLLLVVAMGAFVVVGPEASAMIRIHMQSTTTLALVACALALPLSARSPDLSIAGTAVACGLVAALVGGIPGLLVGLVVAVVVGVVNGALVGLLGLHPVVTTLATGLGLGLPVVLVGGGPGVRVEQPLPAGITVAVLVLLVLVAVAVDAVSVFGRVRSPLPDALHRAAMHVAAAVLAGLAGILQVSHLRFVTPSGASDWLLIGFAAALIGGTSAFGGWRSLFGAVLAAGFLVALRQVLVVLDAESAVSTLVVVILLLVALGADRLRASLTRPRAAVTAR